MLDRPKVHWQGKVVIDYADGDFLVMLPDGEVRLGGDKENASKIARRWFRKHAQNAINLGEIDWRNLPPGVVAGC